MQTAGHLPLAEPLTVKPDAEVEESAADKIQEVVHLLV